MGAVQRTSRLVAEPEVAPTDGGAGLAGGSFTSVTLIVTVIVSSVTVSVVPSSALPSLTPTVTL